MNKSEDNPNVNLAKMLHGAGIRPSLQRIAVLSIVMNGKRHPSADEVFSEMAEMYPSLSRTTVYNALHSLTNAGLIKELEIEAGACATTLHASLNTPTSNAETAARFSTWQSPTGFGSRYPMDSRLIP